MDLDLDQVVKENRAANKAKAKTKKVAPKKGSSGFRRSKGERRRPTDIKKRLVRKRDRSGDRRENPRRDPDQIRVLNLDFKVTDAEVRVS